MNDKITDKNEIDIVFESPKNKYIDFLLRYVINITYVMPIVFIMIFLILFILPISDDQKKYTYISYMLLYVSFCFVFELIYHKIIW